MANEFRAKRLTQGAAGEWDVRIDAPTPAAIQVYCIAGPVWVDYAGCKVPIAVGQKFTFPPQDNIAHYGAVGASDVMVFVYGQGQAPTFGY